MKPVVILLLAAVVAVAAAFVTVRVLAPAQGPQGANSNYDRVVTSKTLRCGYVLNTPGTIRDPNTGRMGGIVPEALDIAAKSLGYKVEWTEEVSYSTMIEGLRSGRYDAICASTYYNAKRAQFTDAVTPHYYTLLFAYARPDDRRFDGSLDAANAPEVRIATLDGEITEQVAAQQFPRAAVVALPHNTDLSQVLLDVADKKADITFVESFLADQFLRSHPGALRNVSANRPLRTYANVMLVRKGDYALKGLLDAMVTELVSSGDMDRLLRKYDPSGTALYPVAAPFAAKAASPR